MKAELILLFIFGHLVGDFLLQTNWMALNKKKNIMACIAHCIVYSIIVLLFTSAYIFSFFQYVSLFFLVFASHFILDYTNIIERWLHLIGSRSYENCVNRSYVTEIEKQFAISYTAIVQTVADNTLHLIMLYYIFKRGLL